MSMRTDIQTDLAAAYDGDLADAVTSITGTREIVGEYDPQLGETPVETVTYQGRGIMGGYTVQEIDNQHILRTDVKLSGALQNELLEIVDGNPADPIEPKVDDMVNGYKVVNVEQDPAGAQWELQLRKV